MLKLIGEIVVAGLSVYAVRKPVQAIVERDVDCSTLWSAFEGGFRQGTDAACVITGALVAFPITATLGAVDLCNDVYRNREAIAISCEESKDWLFSYFEKKEEEPLTFDEFTKVAQLELAV